MLGFAPEDDILVPEKYFEHFVSKKVWSLRLFCGNSYCCRTNTFSLNLLRNAFISVSGKTIALNENTISIN